LFIAESQKKVAEVYMQDGSYEIACPPLQAILKIMVDGKWNGFTIESPEFRSLFTRDTLLQSNWYQQRLTAKQKVDCSLWNRHVDYLTEYCGRANYSSVIERLGLSHRLQLAKEELARCQSKDYLNDLVGTIGTDPSIHH
jgi:hypothetical protein